MMALWMASISLVTSYQNCAIFLSVESRRRWDHRFRMDRKYVMGILLMFPSGINDHDEMATVSQ